MMKANSNTYGRAGRSRLALILAFGIGSLPALGGPFDLSWNTIDGGGYMFSTGGGFKLGGTIGQPDASSFSTPMSGGSFTLVGGFWTAATDACACPGDVNLDGTKNGLDVQQFAQCAVSVGGDCACANVDGLPGVTMNDVSIFVGDLLAGNACP